MFGFSMKKRARDKLRRGTESVLAGECFHVEISDKFGLNEIASAWLYTEAMAHQIYMLIVISNNTLSKRFGWATTEFRIKAINEAITDYEIKEGTTPGSISSFIFRRCTEMDSLSSQDRVAGEHFWQSARKIKELDPKANEELIVQTLEAVSRKYFDTYVNIFG